jgi:MFS family permease
VTVLRDRHSDWHVFAAAAAVATAGVLPVFLTGALAVQLRDDLDVDATGLGLTVATFFGTAALTSTPSGRLAERLGPSAAMRVAAALGAVSLAAVAALARSLVALLGCLVVGGLANALAQPATNLYLARAVAPGRLGVAFGVKQSAIPAATLLGGLAVPAVALTVGWRWAFAAAAVLAALLAAARPGQGAAPRPRGTVGRGREDTALRPLLLLAAGVGLGAAAAGTLGSFLVSSAVAAGIGPGAAGLLSSACSAAGLATRLVLGGRADRRGGRHLAAVVTMLAGGAAGYALLATGRAALVAPGGLVCFCVGWSWPGLFNLAIVRNNPGAPGAATGITQTGTYLGAVAGPLLFGVAVDRWSYGPAWLGAGAVSLLAAAAVATGRRALRADRDRRLGAITG